MKRILLRIILFCAAAGLIPISQAQTKLDRTTTIDVSAVAPRDVFESLSRLLGYELIFAPEIEKPVTMHLENVTVRTALTALSENLGCQWSIAGTSLRIQPAGSGKPGPAAITDSGPDRKRGEGVGSGKGSGIGSGRGAGVGAGTGAGAGKGAGVGESHYRKMMECRTPANFRFDKVSLDSVTDALGKTCNIDIKVDESIKDRIVTVDLSSLTILSALKEISERGDPQMSMSISLITNPSDKNLHLIYIYTKKDR